MSNVNEKAANARNAALHGAMLAFAKPKHVVKTSGSYGVPSREIGAATAAHLAHARPPPAPITRPKISTAPSTHSMRAASLVVSRREREAAQRPPLELLSPIEPAPRPGLPYRAATIATGDRNRSISPSNVAAVLAASRHSSISKIGSSPNGSPQRIAPQRSPRVSYEAGRDIFVPSDGRTMDVREWLENIQPNHSRRHDGPADSTSQSHTRPATSASESVRRGRSVRSARSVASNVTAASMSTTLIRGRPTVSTQFHTNIPTIDIAGASPVAIRRTHHSIHNDAEASDAAESASLYSADGELESAQPTVEAPDYFSHLHRLPSLNTTSLSLAVQPSNSAAAPTSTATPYNPRRSTDTDRPRHSFAPTLRKYNKDLRLSRWAETITSTSTNNSTSRPSLSHAFTSAAIPITSHPSPSPEANPADFPIPPRKSSDYGALLTPLPRSSSDMPFFSHRQRTPSPNKSLRPTLRKTLSSTSEDDKKYRRKHFYQRKHPHKHHEGDRKRWRDAITIRERKRYEGVWAANRGIFLSEYGGGGRTEDSGMNANMHVSNLIVRDIWARSRLSEQVLEEVWELVDRSGEGRLDRDEFVVGMWLIDQRLKGRKLPVKVGSSLWNSVRGIYGLKVRMKE